MSNFSKHINNSIKYEKTKKARDKYRFSNTKILLLFVK